MLYESTGGRGLAGLTASGERQLSEELTQWAARAREIIELINVTATSTINSSEKA